MLFEVSLIYTAHFVKMYDFNSKLFVLTDLFRAKSDKCIYIH